LSILYPERVEEDYGTPGKSPSEPLPKPKNLSCSGTKNYRNLIICLLLEVEEDFPKLPYSLHQVGEDPSSVRIPNKFLVQQEQKPETSASWLT
jgi:hypothetical protein